MITRLKTFLRNDLGLPPWVILALAGCLAHLLLNAILRKPMTSAWGLLGPLAIGIILESYEIWVQYRQLGLFAPGNDPLVAILGRHGLDVLLLLSVPLLIVVVGALSAKY